MVILVVWFVSVECFPYCWFTVIVVLLFCVMGFVSLGVEYCGCFDFVVCCLFARWLYFLIGDLLCVGLIVVYTRLLLFRYAVLLRLISFVGYCLGLLIVYFCCGGLVVWLIVVVYGVVIMVYCLLFVVVCYLFVWVSVWLYFVLISCRLLLFCLLWLTYLYFGLNGWLVLCLNACLLMMDFCLVAGWVV